MKAGIIVLSAKCWSMEDEETKVVRAGVSIHYILTQNLSDFTDTDGTRGYIPIKQSIPIELQKNLVSVPGIYDADLTMKVSDGKNVLKVTSLDYVGDF